MHATGTHKNLEVINDLNRVMTYRKNLNEIDSQIHISLNFYVVHPNIKTIQSWKIKPTYTHENVINIQIYDYNGLEQRGITTNVVELDQNGHCYQRYYAKSRGEAEQLRMPTFHFRPSLLLSLLSRLVFSASWCPDWATCRYQAGDRDQPEINQIFRTLSFCALMAANISRYLFVFSRDVLGQTSVQWYRCIELKERQKQRGFQNNFDVRNALLGLYIQRNTLEKHEEIFWNIISFKINSLRVWLFRLLFDLNPNV